jgi:thioredoxin reductase (NADPH)
MNSATALMTSHKTKGRLDVTLKKGDGTSVTDVFDTVLYATGRNADTGGLALENAGVVAESNGKFVASDGGEMTNVPHIYAVGDVLQGRLELTPVAIKAAELLAKRLFGGATKKMDYEMVCTVRVFRQKFTLEDAIGSHACSLEANMRVTNGIPLGSSLSSYQLTL